MSIMKYGKIIGAIYCGKIDHKGFAMEMGTCVREYIVHKMAFPSNIQVRNLKLRVWHKGQVRTCRRCQSAGHVAKESPNTRDESLKNSSGNFRPELAVRVDVATTEGGSAAAMEAGSRKHSAQWCCLLVFIRLIVPLQLGGQVGGQQSCQ